MRLMTAYYGHEPDVLKKPIGPPHLTTKHEPASDTQFFFSRYHSSTMLRMCAQICHVEGGHTA